MQVSGESYETYIQKPQFRTGPNEWALGFELLQTGDLSYISHGGGYPGFIIRSGLKNKHIIVVLTNVIDGLATQVFNGISSIIEYQLSNQHQYETQAISNITDVYGYYKSRWNYFAFETLTNTLVRLILHQLIHSNNCRFTKI